MSHEWREFVGIGISRDTFTYTQSTLSTEAERGEGGGRGLGLASGARERLCVRLVMRPVLWRAVPCCVPCEQKSQFISQHRPAAGLLALM